MDGGWYLIKEEGFRRGRLTRRVFTDKGVADCLTVGGNNVVQIKDSTFVTIGEQAEGGLVFPTSISLENSLEMF